MGYMPRDQHLEKGLSLTASFDKQATSAVLDLEGDDGKDVHKSHKTKQWYGRTDTIKSLNCLSLEYKLTANL